ncbi:MULTISPECIES: ABC transporter ATP-binding protein [unclassified Leucobacter]|uniref:ABC transporter ATP-binding protein n=1 Tax=unclassified Leucobacter TaxID=2621730 RepID=UPI00165D89EA|nr:MULTISPECIES: ABC transporter ATP-binding protein [unclassified Leucobacter]MBC9937598.1 ABC transporter ATP-binding protein [Leucobacter sp. cx-87]
MNDTKHAGAGGIELARLTKVFPSGAVGIDDVSLTVQPGEFVTFLGPSGSGKTTTLNAIAGFVNPTSGAVVIDGRDVTGLAPNKRNLGMVFQNYALFPHMTVAQNVAFGMYKRGFEKTEVATKVSEALEMVRLGGLGDRRPKELSGGQQQRVALARALVYQPPILLMDEPLGALDKQLRDQMQVEIARLHRDLGTTFLFVTHDQEEALALSDRIVLFRQGHVVQVGTPEELYTRPNSRFAAEFLGESTSFAGTLATTDTLAWAGGVLRGANRTGLAVGADATLVVRPEHLRVALAGDLARADENKVTGWVADLAYLGSHRRVGVRLADGTRVALEARDEATVGVNIGDEVSVCWRAEHGVLVGGGLG